MATRTDISILHEQSNNNKAYTSRVGSGTKFATGSWVSAWTLQWQLVQMSLSVIKNPTPTRYAPRLLNEEQNVNAYECVACRNPGVLVVAKRKIQHQHNMHLVC